MPQDYVLLFADCCTVPSALLYIKQMKIFWESVNMYAASVRDHIRKTLFHTFNLILEKEMKISTINLDR